MEQSGENSGASEAVGQMVGPGVGPAPVPAALAAGSSASIVAVAPAPAPLPPPLPPPPAPLPVKTVAVIAGVVELEATLIVPPGAIGIVVFPHGGGSSRHSPRDRALGRSLLDAGFATLQLDLLTPHEIELDLSTRHLRFDVDLLAGRLSSATGWLAWHEQTRGLPIGFFGTGVGTAAALIAAADRPDAVAAIVSRGGRPDLAGPILSEVEAPTLFVVGGSDTVVRVLNHAAVGAMRNSRELRVIPGAGHMFEEAGALPQVSSLAVDWFRRHLRPESPGGAPRRAFAHTIRRT